MSSQYTISPAHFQSEYHIYCHVQSVHHLTCQSSVSSSPLLPSPVRILTFSDRVQSPLLPKFTQYTIAPAHDQSEYNLSYPYPVVQHLSCPWSVSSLSILLMSSQYTTASAQVKSVDHIIWPCLVRILPLMSISRQYTISTAHIQSL